MDFGFWGIIFIMCACAFFVLYFIVGEYYKNNAGKINKKEENNIEYHQPENLMDNSSVKNESEKGSAWAKAIVIILNILATISAVIAVIFIIAGVVSDNARVLYLVAGGGLLNSSLFLFAFGVIIKCIADTSENTRRIREKLDRVDISTN